MGSLAVEGGYDLFLTDIGDAYVVEYGSPVGMEILARHKGARESTDEDMSRFRAVQDAKWPKFTYKLEMNISDLPNLLAIGYDNPLWEELGEKCLALRKFSPPATVANSGSWQESQMRRRCPSFKLSASLSTTSKQ